MNLTPHFSPKKFCEKSAIFYNRMITNGLLKHVEEHIHKITRQNHQISMMEHIFLSFPPYCGIFNSTQRESSAREISQPAPSNQG